MRTPLTPLRLRLGVLEREVERTGMAKDAARELTQALHGAEAQLLRLAHVSQDVHDLAALRSGHLSLERAEVDLGQLVQDVLADLKREVRVASCTVLADLEPAVRGSWDARWLQRLTAHLVGNALKFGAGAPVEVSVRRDERHAWLSVVDHGVGVPLADQERVFQLFERAVPINNYGGFGIGLFVAREVAKAHGGVLVCQSAPGAGATFTCELPLHPPV
jgi:signal transduction histidine kinase